MFPVINLTRILHSKKLNDESNLVIIIVSYSFTNNFHKI